MIELYHKQANPIQKIYLVLGIVGLILADLLLLRSAFLQFKADNFQVKVFIASLGIFISFFVLAYECLYAFMSSQSLCLEEGVALVIIKNKGFLGKSLRKVPIEQIDAVIIKGSQGVTYEGEEWWIAIEDASGEEIWRTPQSEYSRAFDLARRIAQATNRNLRIPESLRAEDINSEVAK